MSLLSLVARKFASGSGAFFPKKGLREPGNLAMDQQHDTDINRYS